MFIQLPKPYPDELLYSVIARFFVHYGITCHGHAIRQIFGRLVDSAVDLPSSLNHVSSVTWMTWEMTGDEILESLTLFPFYSRLLPTDRRIHCALDFKEGGRLGIRSRLGVSASIVSPKSHLEYCAQCSASDLLQYGETYWHRIHQTPGVLVCSIHGTPLIKSSANAGRQRIVRYVDATSCYESDTLKQSAISLNSLEWKLSAIVAAKCQELLAGEVHLLDEEKTRFNYQNRLIELGFCSSSGLRSLDRIEKAFISFYTIGLLNKFGVEIHPGARSSWIRRIFGKGCYSLHPLLHVLTKVFLDNIEVQKNQGTPFSFFLGHGPWRCPNRYAQHSKAYPIKTVGRKINRGVWIATAVCDCGFRFSFREVSVTDPSAPIKWKIYRHGALWEAEALRLKMNGLTTSEIAIEMGITTASVKKLLETQVLETSKRTRKVTNQQINKWRREFLSYRNKSSDKRSELLRQRYKVLYSLLWKYDVVWLKKLTAVRIGTKKCSSIDWAARDEEWQHIIHKTAKTIRDEIPLHRVSANSIFLRSRLLRVQQNIYRLPKVASALKTCVESLDAYKIRKLHSAAQRLKEEGVPLTRSRLLRYAKIPHNTQIGTESNLMIRKFLNE